MSNGGLIDQVADRLGPDGVYNELRKFLPSLQAPSGQRVEVKSLCPYHDDHRPSLNWNLEKGVANCFVCEKGVSFVRVIAEKTGRKPVIVLDEFCRRFGLPRPRHRVLTVADYATAKGIPGEFLTDRFGLVDTPEGMQMPYFARDGSLVAVRLRKSLRQRPR